MTTTARKDMAGTITTDGGTTDGETTDGETTDGETTDGETTDGETTDGETAIGTDPGATIKTSKAIITHLDTMITIPGHKTIGAMEVPTAGVIMAIGTGQIGVTIKASETTITGRGTTGGGKITEKPSLQDHCGEVT